MKLFLPQGDNHLPRKNVGTEIEAATYRKFQAAAAAEGRSVSGLLRKILTDAVSPRGKGSAK